MHVFVLGTSGLMWNLGLIIRMDIRTYALCSCRYRQSAGVSSISYISRKRKRVLARCSPLHCPSPLCLPPWSMPPSAGGAEAALGPPSPLLCKIHAVCISNVMPCHAMYDYVLGRRKSNATVPVSNTSLPALVYAFALRYGL